MENDTQKSVRPKTNWRDIWYSVCRHYEKYKKKGGTMGQEIEITEENYLSLRKAYRKAVAEHREQFVWRGNELVTDFAKYVLQYMETFPYIKPVIPEDDPEEDE